MRIILYYIFLLIGIGLITAYIAHGNDADAGMGMTAVLSLCGMLALYAAALSFVGEGKVADEREGAHRYIATRAALILGTTVMTVGIISQLFITHQIDYWLLAGLGAINLTKIATLIWLNYRK